MNPKDVTADTELRQMCEDCLCRVNRCLTESTGVSLATIEGDKLNLALTFGQKPICAIAKSATIRELLALAANVRRLNGTPPKTSPGLMINPYGTTEARN